MDCYDAHILVSSSLCGYSVYTYICIFHTHIHSDSSGVCLIDCFAVRIYMDVALVQLWYGFDVFLPVFDDCTGTR